MNKCRRSIKLIDIVLWIVFSLWLVIDSITGFFLNSGKDVPISQLIKGFVLIAIIIRISIYQKYQRYLLVTFLYLGWTIIIMGLDRREISTTFIHLSKFLSTIYLYIYFTLCYRIFCEDFEIKAYGVIKIGLFIVIANVIIGYLGYGFYTYKTLEIGYSGFFFAGNELGGVITTIVPFILYTIYLSCSKNKYIIFSIIIILISIGIATKAAVASTIIFIIIIPWLYSSRKGRIRLAWYTFISLIIIIPILGYYINNSTSDLINRISWVYQSQGLVGVFLSGRDDYWTQEQQEILGSPIIFQIFGLGEGRSVEMDHLDLLLNYGWFGTITTLLLFLFLLINAYNCKKNNSYVKLLIIQDCILICIAFIAGHIVFSSMAGLYIALINSLMWIKKDRSKCLISI